MIIDKSELLVYFDVDETLVRDSLLEEECFSIEHHGTVKFKVAIESHVALLKSYHARGYRIYVWSANGWEWAAQVIQALGLTRYVYQVQSKPLKFVDDKPAENWMHRVFIGEEN